MGFIECLIGFILGGLTGAFLMALVIGGKDNV